MTDYKNAVKIWNERDRALNQKVDTLRARLDLARRERERPALRMLNQQLLTVVNSAFRRLQSIEKKSAIRPGRSRIFFY